jgi:hypothetical protein
MRSLFLNRFRIFLMMYCFFISFSPVVALDIRKYDLEISANGAEVVNWNTLRDLKVDDIILDEVLDAETMAVIEPRVFRDQPIRVRLLINRDHVNNKILFEEVKHFFSDPPFPRGQIGWIEAEFNAKLGSTIAKAQLRYATLSLRRYSYRSYGHLKALKPVGEQEERDFKKAASARRALWNKQRLQFNALEQKDSKKLDALVRTDDRKGTRKVLETYLPWPLMDPVERSMWREWLDVMERPDPKRKILVFRGLDDDPKLKSEEGVPYFLSTLLSKNQGNYNRRLRSFAVQRERFKFEGGPAQIMKNGSSIFSAMHDHSLMPIASPWLSTSSLEVAARFGQTRLGAFLIDERLAMVNIFAEESLAMEMERLVPLILFPSDLIFEQDKGIDINSFRARVEQKLRRELTNDEIYGDFARHKKDISNTMFDLLEKARQRDFKLPEHLPVCKVL